MGRGKDTPPDLIFLDRFKEGAEIAFTKAFIALALDKLEEDRPQHGAGENLQQQAVAAIFKALAIDQNATAFHPTKRFAGMRQTLRDLLLIVDGRRGHD